MITVLLTRKNEAHIVSFRRLNGDYRTVCGKTYTKKSKVNTIAADNTFSGACSICKKFVDDTYLSDLNHNKSMARGDTVTNIQSDFMYHEFNLINDDHPHAYMESRYWPKLNKYQKHIPKAKVNGAKKKSYKKPRGK